MTNSLTGPWECSCGRSYCLVPGDLLVSDEILVPFAHGLCGCGICHVSIWNGTRECIAKWLMDKSMAMWGASSAAIRWR